jgi:F-type H+-transporting ATPase subunit b
MKILGNTIRLVKVLALAAVVTAPAGYALAQEAPPSEQVAPAPENPAVGEPHNAEEAKEVGAEEGGGHHSMFSSEAEPGQTSLREKFIYSAINFLLMVGLLTFLLRKPLADFLTNRRAEISKSIDEAKAAKQKAEKALAEHRQKMAAIEGELNTLRSEIISAGDRERDNILTAAKAQAAKIVDDARLMGEQEVRKAKAELREEMVKLASVLAEKTLRSSVSPQEREKQLNEFVSKLEAL